MELILIIVLVIFLFGGGDTGVVVEVTGDRLRLPQSWRYRPAIELFNADQTTRKVNGVAGKSSSGMSPHSTPIP
jgi:hypothetical protein